MNRNSKLLSIIAAAFAFALMLAMAGCGQQASSSASSAASANASGAASANASGAASASASSAAAADEVAFKMTIDATDVDKGVLYDESRTAKKGATVYEALADTGLDLSVNNSGGTVYIDGISGVVASETGSNAGWLFTVNGKTPSTGAETTEINDGDEVVWTFYKDYTTAM